MVYVKSSSSAADIEKAATSKPTNQDDSTDQDEVPMLFKRLNSPSDFLDKTRDEVTAAAAALQEMFLHQYASAPTTEQRDAPEPKKWTPPIASARDHYESSIASCAPMSTSNEQGVVQSPFTCSDFSKFDVPTLTCIDPSTLISEAKQVKPKALATSMESAILTQIDATERSIFGVIAPKDTARLDAMEQKLAMLKEDSDFHRTDTLDTFRREDTFTLAESPNSTFDSIDAAPSMGDDSTFNRTRSKGSVNSDEIELEHEEPISPASEHEPNTNERKTPSNANGQQIQKHEVIKTKGWFKKKEPTKTKGKAKGAPSKKKKKVQEVKRTAPKNNGGKPNKSRSAHVPVDYDITRMASF